MLTAVQTVQTKVQAMQTKVQIVHSKIILKIQLIENKEVTLLVELNW